MSPIDIVISILIFLVFAAFIFGMHYGVYLEHQETQEKKELKELGERLDAEEAERLRRRKKKISKKGRRQKIGILNLKEEKEILKFITGSLKRRGMKPVIDGDWEVHGPHPGMDYQVFVGEEKENNTNDIWLVAIYPKAVYIIGKFTDWWNVGPENRIFIDNSKD